MSKVLVVTGPSGIGKTYLAKYLSQKFPGVFYEAKLYTTRQQRQGESSADRTFISFEEFSRKKRQGDFVISSQFHDNWYGYTEKNLVPPPNKHLVVNTWPGLLPKFLERQDTIIIGLTVKPENINLLYDRLASRGDSKQIARERQEIITKDIAFLHTMAKNFREQDRLFVVQNDQTFEHELVPWLEGVLELH